MAIDSKMEWLMRTEDHEEEEEEDFGRSCKQLQI